MSNTYINTINNSNKQSNQSQNYANKSNNTRIVYVACQTTKIIRHPARKHITCNLFFGARCTLRAICGFVRGSGRENKSGDERSQQPKRFLLDHTVEKNREERQRRSQKAEIEFALRLQFVEPLVLRFVDFDNLHVALQRQKPPDKLLAKCVAQH